MKDFFNELANNVISDVMVSGYLDTETPPIFHPMYERIYFFICDDIFEVYINDGVIDFNILERIDKWFDLDDDDTFSLMSIYSQLFKTEQSVAIESIDYNNVPFSDMGINYSDGENKKLIHICPNNFFGFTFYN
ncbi:TPA: hypothetical protein PPN70_004871 [Serratia rubidaea]|nr:hypothetical protein [Serratia rubidaea]HDJ1450217.1 hypothetical protein [Serratia rubidaea]HDJ1464268.1 hypothetical protein [Serratia rubidaea]HDJ2774952.1 hypothetical protein [Serratia rubidaea]